MKKPKLTQKQVANKYGFRSGLEDKVGDQILAVEGKVEYEPLTLKYIQPIKQRKYTPDFILKNGVIIETKGRFLLEDRQKHLYIKEQYPDLDIRFIFARPKEKLRKNAKTSYADWCTQHGFLYAEKTIPEEWFHETK